MKLPYSWLAELVRDIPAANELADILTMRGFEIEEISSPGEAIQDVVIGKILECGPHPNADKLSLCKVTDGTETYPIVCGASNMKSGDCIALARVGSTLPGDFKIEKRKIRGEVSLGMMCSSRELGLGDDHSGIMILPGDTELGKPLVDEIGLNETVFEINVTPNRPDALSAIGIAREIAAACNSSVTLPEHQAIEPTTNADFSPSIELIDEDLCPRYTAIVIENINIAPSPGWLKTRLEGCGVRSVNNVVDITNLVLMEFGQPLHAFDYDKLNGSKIIVRKARDGETITSIDGDERKLNENNLVIADEQSPVAIAGVMGGLESEVGDTTTSILLESAYFKPSSIRRTAKQLSMSSEASYRFERGVDLEMVIPAAWRCAHLIQQLAGGQVKGLMTIADAKEASLLENLGSRQLSLGLDYCARLLGQTIPTATIESIFNSLNLQVIEKDPGKITVLVPSYRQDIVREADLVEEIARCYGYNQFEPTLPVMPVQLPEPMTIDRKLKREIRSYLTGSGLDEAVSYSFANAELMPPFQMDQSLKQNEQSTMLNPISSLESCMRTSILPSLLLSAKRNVAHGNAHFGLFELARKFEPTAEDVDEKPALAAMIVGNPGLSWKDNRTELDYFYLKGIVEGLFAICGIKNYRSIATPAGLHPKRSIGVQLGKSIVGYFGELHPDLTQQYELSGRILVFEFYLEPLSEFYRKSLVQFKPFSSYPSVRRDMALLVPDNQNAQQIEKVTKRVCGALLEEIQLFDYYKGKQVQEGYASLAFRLSFRSITGTLKEDEIDKLFEQLNTALKTELGVELRT